jgi:hypothetical protein
MSKGQRPAFPHVTDRGGATEWGTGITIRDYFASKAMQGLLAKYGSTDLNIPRIAYELADKMIEQREK